MQNLTIDPSFSSLSNKRRLIVRRLLIHIFKPRKQIQTLYYECVRHWCIIQLRKHNFKSSQNSKAIRTACHLYFFMPSATGKSLIRKNKALCSWIGCIQYLDQWIERQNYDIIPILFTHNLLQFDYQAFKTSAWQPVN